jgi:hypothetical protein
MGFKTLLLLGYNFSTQGPQPSKVDVIRYLRLGRLDPNQFLKTPVAYVPFLKLRVKLHSKRSE